MKNLLDFHEREVVTPTPTTRVEEQENPLPVVMLDYYKTPVYLASELGFKNYCSTCPRLLKKEEIPENKMWKYRVICSILKCEK